MHLIVSFIAYVSAAAAGMKVLAVLANSFAMTAAENIRLPPPNPNPPLTLVERRIVAQNTTVVAKPALRRVVALSAPETPIALLALNLDVAETAFVPTVRVVNSVPDTEVAATPKLGKRPLADGVRAVRSPPQHKQRAHGQARSKIAHAATNKIAHAKSKTRPSVKLVSSRPSGAIHARRLAGFETPGALMYRALLNRQS